MQNAPHWDDYAFFNAIARTGGLKKAADETGVSAATLSRRMRAFEVRLGRRLFRHGAHGYALTAEGLVLYARTEPMEAAARDILRWEGVASGPVCVRISAGTWTALDLARNLARYWDAAAPWLPEFVYCDDHLDIARREIDIGIRSSRPDQPWLAGQQVGTVDFAVYARDDTVSGWIGPAHGAPDVASSRWLLREHGDRVVTKANSPQLSCALAVAGIGRVVLPTFAGDRMPGLERLSDPIEELTAPQWLISHHDGRNEPATRTALDALSSYLKARDRP